MDPDESLKSKSKGEKIEGGARAPERGAVQGVPWVQELCGVQRCTLLFGVPELL